MTRATHEEYLRGGQAGFEAENRVLYVAVTRTQDKLVLVQPGGRRHYDLPREGEIGA
jgi:ATP-dependent exoDNAse (exonuclease V) beta subunit